MAFLDSSVIVDYLDEVEAVVQYVDEQPHLLTISKPSTDPTPMGRQPSAATSIPK